MLALEQWLFQRAAANGVSMLEAGQGIAAAPLRPTGPGYPDVLCNFVSRGSYGGSVSLFIDDDGKAVPHRPDLLSAAGAGAGSPPFDRRAHTTSDFCRAVLTIICAAMPPITV